MSTGSSALRGKAAPILEERKGLAMAIEIHHSAHFSLPAMPGNTMLGNTMPGGALRLAAGDRRSRREGY
jgi:hypothetical protein